MEHEVVQQIQKEAASFIKRTSNRVSVFAVMIEGQQVKVAYDRKRKTIVTIMTLE